MFQDLKKLNQILTRREQFKFAILLFAITAMAFMQALGVASVMPFIAIVLEPAMIFENRWLSLVCHSLGFGSLNAFNIFSRAAMFMIIVLANGVYIGGSSLKW